MSGLGLEPLTFICQFGYLQHELTNCGLLYIHSCKQVYEITTEQWQKRECHNTPYCFVEGLCSLHDRGVFHVLQHLRQIGVVGKFVEFFGPGVSHLSIADRATIANMCPEYGATVGFFPVDEKSLLYLRQTGKMFGKNFVMILISYPNMDCQVWCILQCRQVTVYLNFVNSYTDYWDSETDYESSYICSHQLSVLEKIGDQNKLNWPKKVWQVLVVCSSQQSLIMFSLWLCSLLMSSPPVSVFLFSFII